MKLVWYNTKELIHISYVNRIQDMHNTSHVNNTTILPILPGFSHRSKYRLRYRPISHFLHVTDTIWENRLPILFAA